MWLMGRSSAGLMGLSRLALLTILIDGTPGQLSDADVATRRFAVHVARQRNAAPAWSLVEASAQAGRACTADGIWLGDMVRATHNGHAKGSCLIRNVRTFVTS